MSKRKYSRNKCAKNSIVGLLKRVQLLKAKCLFTGYQYGYGLPGLPGGFNPFLLNPGWLDAAYLSTYGWNEYFRTRNVTLPQQNIHQPPLVKATSPQLPTPNIHPTNEFYVHQNNATSPTFHPPHFLPSSTLLPQFPTSTPAATSGDNYHNISRPVPPMEQLSLRLSPISNTQSLSPQQNLTHDSRINSTVVDQSNSENEDVEDAVEEEEEDEIDVVKSAFHPIKAASLLLQEIHQHPDSTVKEEPIKRCDLKAPSSKKIQTIVVSQKSPSTKIHTTTTTKNVWRPY